MDIFDRVNQVKSQKEKLLKMQKPMSNTAFNFYSNDDENFFFQTEKIEFANPQPKQPVANAKGFFAKRKTQKVLKLCEDFIKEVNILGNSNFFVVGNLVSELQKFSADQINFEYLEENNYFIAYVALKDEKIAQALYNLGFDFDALWRWSQTGPKAFVTYDSSLFIPYEKGEGYKKANIAKKCKKLGIVSGIIKLTPSLAKFMKDLETKNLFDKKIYQFINLETLNTMIKDKTLTEELANKIKQAILSKQQLQVDDIQKISKLFAVGAISLNKQEIQALTQGIMQNSNLKMPKNLYYFYHHTMGEYPDVEMFEWNKNQPNNNPTTQKQPNPTSKVSKKKQLTAAEKKIEEIFDMAEDNVK